MKTWTERFFFVFFASKPTNKASAKCKQNTCIQLKRTHTHTHWRMHACPSACVSTRSRDRGKNYAAILMCDGGEEIRGGEVVLWITDTRFSFPLLSVQCALDSIKKNKNKKNTKKSTSLIVLMQTWSLPQMPPQH